MKIKETLREVIEPLRYLDGKILRNYTKFVHRYEKKGGDKYALAEKLIYSTSIPIGVGLGISLNRANPEISSLEAGIIAIPFIFWILSDLNHTHLSKFYNHTTSDEKAVNPIEYLLGQIGRITRLPSLGTSLFFTSKGLLNVYNSIKTGDSSLLGDSLTDFLLAYSFFAVPSSSYIKDADDKFLEKQPMWRDALDLVKKGIERILPQPIPVPISNYLEERL